MRILYGLDRLPRSLAFDDPRLPGIDLGPAPLRLNTEPVPPAVLAAAPEGHAGRVGAMMAWLQSQCGDYAVPQRRFMAAYMDWAAAELAAHSAALRQALSPYQGVYREEDWLWSALRPLPRAWLMGESGPVRFDVAFWDGECLTTVPGVDALPARCHAFWQGEGLPRSPFRRPPLGMSPG